MTYHLIKLLIERLVEVFESLQSYWTDFRMSPTLSPPQTVGVPTFFWFLETWEALGGIEVKMFVIYHRFKAKKVLYSGDFFGGFTYQFLSTHDVDPT